MKHVRHLFQYNLTIEYNDNMIHTIQIDFALMFQFDYEAFLICKKKQFSLKQYSILFRSNGHQKEVKIYI